MKIHMNEIYWLAGILEGEGCFSRNNGRTPRIMVSMTDLDVMEHIQRLMGGIMYYPQLKPNRKQMYALSFTQQRVAAGWMMTLYPLMSKRRQDKIREILLQWLTQPDGRKAVYA